MADKQKKDRPKGSERKPAPTKAIHTADELEELILDSVRAGTFPAKFFPSWSARLQIEVGKVVREGKIQRHAGEVFSRGAPAKSQKSEVKPEKNKSQEAVVLSGILKFLAVWNKGNLPKLSFGKDQIQQSYKDDTLADMIRLAILRGKPANVEPVAYRSALADFMISHLGFVPKIRQEITESGEKIDVKSKFDLILEKPETGPPKSQILLSLSEEEYKASHKWFPGVRASLRELSGQKQKRSQPKPSSDGQTKSAAGGGAKSDSPPSVLDEDTIVSASSDIPSFGDEEDIAVRLLEHLTERFPDRGFERIDITNKDVKKYSNLKRQQRRLRRRQLQSFLDMDEPVGAFCLALLIQNSGGLDYEPGDFLELNRKQLKRILLPSVENQVLRAIKKLSSTEPPEGGQPAN